MSMPDTAPPPLQILLVEDSEADVQIFQQMLSAPPGTPCNLIHAYSLGDASKLIQKQPVDLILLDLNLPDSEGAETLQALRQILPKIPIILTTDIPHGTNEAQTVQYMAQDVLPKEILDKDRLLRSIRYAIAFHKLNQELEQERLQKKQQEEFHAIWTKLLSNRANVTGKYFESSLLEDSLPARFHDLTRQFLELFDQALAEQGYHIPRNLAHALADLAAQLANLHAGPRDVISLYQRALQQKLTGLPILKQEAYLNEGRILVLQLMGDLLSHYRMIALSRATGMAQPPLPSQPAQPGPTDTFTPERTPS